ncbi:MAG: hypothetical protein DRR16_18135 [Candidatus Parabeggiatoa sp. nov. 3]|nr:MAG: hypothetical protein DRR00_07585 [Gammaproteobacteria bacterium]RKZ61908.1 MAG: hypothetical protein DRQ99_19615 [Gammaproteobacteria bacterium]RKZ83109.1 MAG: hypothetical protein DRR16_18135 [Gammaproteobacteria bacterium]
MSLTRKDVHVEITLIKGDDDLTGTMLIDRDSRLSDALNNSRKHFIVLSDYNGIHHILNKRHIVKAVEIESLELEPNKTE